MSFRIAGIWSSNNLSILSLWVPSCLSTFLAVFSYSCCNLPIRWLNAKFDRANRESSPDISFANVISVSFRTAMPSGQGQMLPNVACSDVGAGPAPASITHASVQGSVDGFV